MTIFAALPLLLVQAATPSPAASGPPSTPPSPGSACQAAPYRQFDFWIGEWEVTNQQCPAGRSCPTSRSRISRVLNGCAILEEYETPSGYAGKSLNFYDGKGWHQVWIDTGGAPLFLDGGLQGASMVLGDKGGRSGAVNRITWTPMDGGRVRQHWEISKDGGKTFETGFDGLYTPRPAR